MNHLLTVNLDTKQISGWTPPTITFGETLSLSMRFAATIEGADVEQSLDVRALAAAVGEIDARPTGGSWKLRIGPAPATEANTTAALPWNVSASALQSAINALATVVADHGAAKVVAADDSFLIQFGSGGASIAMAVVENFLWPVALGKIGAFQRPAGQWAHEVRLIQAPVAFASSNARVLPDAPSIARVQAGGSSGGDLVFWNEIQALTVPPAFRGTYQIRKGYAKTGLFSQADGPAELAAGLEAAFGSGFKVTNPLANVANIEFVGDFEGAAQDLLEVVVVNAPEGDLTFAIAFDRHELAARLRLSPVLTLPFDVAVTVADSEENLTELPLFRVPITIQRPLIWPELAETPSIDWLRPVSPRDYIPFTPDQVITGTQYYTGMIGDGESTEFVVDHGLGSESVFVAIRVNASEGRLLTSPADYGVVVIDANSVKITPTGEPLAAGAWAFTIASAGPKSAFQAHTHTIAQIVGLQDVLDDLGSRVTVLEEILPSTGPTATVASGTGLVIELGAKAEVLFAADGVKVDQLSKRPPYMLPAVHTSTTDALPDPLPAVVADTVWAASARTLIPGGGQIRSSYVPADGFVASDGRCLYPAIRSGTTKSYYPAVFERELWRIFINDKQLAVNRTLDVRFGVDLQLINATSAAQWVLVIEKGTAPQDTSPATTGNNLQNLVWDLANPLVSQRLILTPLVGTHPFGCRIYRKATGITADAMSYGVWSGANSAAPETANFALRARLINFDTEDSIPTAVGWVRYALKGTPEGPETPQARII